MICVLLMAAFLFSGCSLFPTEEAAISSESEPAASILLSETEQVTEGPSASSAETAPAEEGHLIVIDPGHQRSADFSTEPVGPGASEQKMKVSGGTQGAFTGIPEYELNMVISLALRDELERRGYRVLLTHESVDVSISNAERAVIANEAEADAFLRIHANGSEDSGREGVMTICMTAYNPYNSTLYEESRRLSDCVLSSLCASTGSVSEGVWETDTMTGINYSAVPVTIVEMGYMSNEKEDRLMATDEYRTLIVQGIADGIDRYFFGEIT